MTEILPLKIRESDLVNAYLWSQYRENPQWRRVRLGMVPTKAFANMYKVILRWADAVVIDAPHVLIIEAKLRPNAGAIGQLEHYAKLLRKTPEFSQYSGYPLKLVLLTMVTDYELVELTSEKDIAYVVFPEEQVRAFQAAHSPRT